MIHMKDAEQDLSGKVALVTGAAQGLGEATVRALARRGANLVLTDIKADALEKVASSLTKATAIAVVADVAEPQGPTKIIAEALTAFGQIDLLASVAGANSRGTITSTSVADWDYMMSLNLRSHFQLIQATAVHLIERDAPGAIVCVGSVQGRGGQPDLCSYAVAKGGLATLVKNSAYALLPHQIRVNLVNFGWMHTPGEIDSHLRSSGNDEAWVNLQAAQLPFGRLIKPAEAANLITYLLSSESSVMTGAEIDFDQSVGGAGPATVARPDRLTTSWPVDLRGTVAESEVRG